MEAQRHEARRQGRNVGQTGMTTGQQRQRSAGAQVEGQAGNRVVVKQDGYKAVGEWLQRRWGNHWQEVVLQVQR